MSPIVGMAVAEFRESGKKLYLVADLQVIRSSYKQTGCIGSRRRWNRAEYRSTLRHVAYGSIIYEAEWEI